MKRWLKHMFYIPKHQKQTDENIMRLLMPSAAGIVLCMICLAGFTWAWFSASLVNEGNSIQATSYNLNVSVKDENQEDISPQDGVYCLTDGPYTVTLQASEDGASTGYCKIIKIDDKDYYTDQIKRGETFILTICESGRYTFTAMWGESDGASNVINNNGSIGAYDTDESSSGNISVAGDNPLTGAVAGDSHAGQSVIRQDTAIAGQEPPDSGFAEEEYEKPTVEELTRPELIEKEPDAPVSPEISESGDDAYTASELVTFTP